MGSSVEVEEEKGRSRKDAESATRMREEDSIADESADESESDESADASAARPVDASKEDDPHSVPSARRAEDAGPARIAVG